MPIVKRHKRKSPRYREITSQQEYWKGPHDAKGFGVHLVSPTGAYIGGAGVGMRAVVPYKSSKTKMCDYGVEIEPRYRGEGYGYLVFEEAMRNASEAGCTCLAGHTPSPRQVTIRSTLVPDTEFRTDSDTYISVEEALELTERGEEITALTPLKKGGCK